MLYFRTIYNGLAPLLQDRNRPEGTLYTPYINLLTISPIN
jgi:hypothetical protein